MSQNKIELEDIAVGPLVEVDWQLAYHRCEIPGQVSDTEPWFHSFIDGPPCTLPQMEILASFQASLSARERRVFESHVVWPAFVVIDQRSEFESAGVIGWGPPSAVLNLSELEQLDARERRDFTLVVFEGVASAMAVLHQRGLAIGGLNTRNAAWYRGPDSRAAGLLDGGSVLYVDQSLSPEDAISADLLSFGMLYQQSAGSLSAGLAVPATSPAIDGLVAKSLNGTAAPAADWAQEIKNLRTGDFVAPQAAVRLSPKVETDKSARTPQSLAPLAPAKNKSPLRPSSPGKAPAGFPAESDELPEQHRELRSGDVRCGTAPIAATVTASPEHEPQPTTKRRASRIAALVLGAVALAAIAVAATLVITGDESGDSVTTALAPEPDSDNTRSAEDNNESVSAEVAVTASATPSPSPAPTVTPTANATPVPASPNAALERAALLHQEVEIFGCRSSAAVSATVISDDLVIFDDRPPIPAWWVASPSLSESGHWRSFASADDVHFAVRYPREDQTIPSNGLQVNDQIILVDLDRFHAATVSSVARFDPDGDFFVTAPDPLGNYFAYAETGAPLGPTTHVGDELLVVRNISTLDSAMRGCEGATTGVRTSRDWQTASQSPIRGLLALQRLSDAFAAGDWATVRRIDLQKADYTSSRFIEGWGAIHESVAFPIRPLSPSGDIQRWRLAILGHENTSAGRVSTAFCVTWEVTTTTGTVAQFASESEAIYTLSEPIAGWMPFSELAAQVAWSC